MNKEAIEQAGFTVDQAGKVRVGGKLVKAEVAEAAARGGIIANFDPNELRRKKVNKAAQGGKSLVEALNAISPDIALLNVGMTAKVAIPKTAEGGKNPLRSFMMGVVTKLNNVTQAGREWAGRKFDTLSDEDGEFAYITRLPDGEPHVRKTPTSRSGAAAANSSNNLAEALAGARQHLSGNSEEGKEEGQQEGGEASEEATVLTH